MADLDHLYGVLDRAIERGEISEREARAAWCICRDCSELRTSYLAWWRRNRKGRPSVTIPRDLLESLIALAERVELSEVGSDA